MLSLPQTSEDLRAHESQGNISLGVFASMPPGGAWYIVVGTYLCAVLTRSSMLVIAPDPHVDWLDRLHRHGSAPPRTAPPLHKRLRWLFPWSPGILSPHSSHSSQVVNLAAGLTGT
jgi:hypothetical protein